MISPPGISAIHAFGPSKKALSCGKNPSFIKRTSRYGPKIAIHTLKILTHSGYELNDLLISHLYLRPIRLWCRYAPAKKQMTPVTIPIHPYGLPLITGSNPALVVPKIAQVKRAASNAILPMLSSSWKVWTTCGRSCWIFDSQGLSIRLLSSFLDFLTYNSHWFIKPQYEPLKAFLEASMEVLWTFLPVCLVKVPVREFKKAYMGAIARVSHKKPSRTSPIVLSLSAKIKLDF